MHAAAIRKALCVRHFVILNLSVGTVLLPVNARRLVLLFLRIFINTPIAVRNGIHNISISQIIHIVK